MKILIACEESQVVCSAFRLRGHEAFSCDLLESSGEHPEWHIKGDVRDYLSLPWDLIIAFPPCTDLASSGARWFPGKIANGNQQRSVDFFKLFTEHPCPHKAIENQVSIMSARYRRPDQIIQPWQFGHGEVKATCLWLTGLPLLVPTHVVAGRYPRVHLMPPGPDRAKERSKTYPGIAEAMALQWGSALLC